MKKRIIFKLCAIVLAFASGGAIVNVAVAWVGNLEAVQRPMARSRVEPGGYFTQNGAWIEFSGTDALICTSLQWSIGLPHPKIDAERRKRLRSAPYWSAVASLPSYTTPSLDVSQPRPVYREVASGFPMMSMVLHSRRTGQAYEHMTPFIRLPDRQFTTFGIVQTLERQLPLQPYWPGFLINTVFYATVLWVLFAGPGFVKRRIRVMRGRCRACGYSLHNRAPDSTRCPECGATV